MRFSKSSVDQSFQLQGCCCDGSCLLTYFCGFLQLVAKRVRGNAERFDVEHNVAVDNRSIRLSLDVAEAVRMQYLELLHERTLARVARSEQQQLDFAALLAVHLLQLAIDCRRPQVSFGFLLAACHVWLTIRCESTKTNSQLNATIFLTRGFFRRFLARAIFAIKPKKIRNFARNFCLHTG